MVGVVAVVGGLKDVGSIAPTSASSTPLSPINKKILHHCCSRILCEILSTHLIARNSEDPRLFSSL
ncbi:hypothetical protein PP707_07855 [Acetobacter pasteurianus]|nr:hypothetical protein [Acetobacter pasteurianus]